MPHRAWPEPSGLCRWRAPHRWRCKPGMPLMEMAQSASSLWLGLPKLLLTGPLPARVAALASARGTDQVDSSGLGQVPAGCGLLAGLCPLFSIFTRVRGGSHLGKVTCAQTLYGLAYPGHHPIPALHIHRQQAAPEAFRISAKAGLPMKGVSSDWSTPVLAPYSSGL